MPDSNSKTPEMPNIPAPTKESFNRAICADYLEAIARLIRKGSVRGISFAWDDRIEKPIGTVNMSAEMLLGPMELELMQKASEMQAQEQTSIPVEDISEDIKDHKCNHPGCLVCNNSKNVNKA